MSDGMNTAIRLIAAVTIIVIALAVVFYFLSSSEKTEEISSKNIFAQGCIAYCNELHKEANPIKAAIQKAQDLEGSDFIKACKYLYRDIKYNWQCWNRECCTFKVYYPV